VGGPAGRLCAGHARRFGFPAEATPQGLGGAVALGSAAAAAGEGSAAGSARRRPRAMSPVVLSLEDLHFSFGGLKVLDGVRMQVRRGEIRGLIGPNGAGKTTLLNIICGIHRPQQGDVRLNGVSIVGRKPSAIARLGLGRTFQSSQLFQGMTVLENMMVGL